MARTARRGLFTTACDANDFAGCADWEHGGLA
jgi:hypothetical protein